MPLFQSRSCRVPCLRSRRGGSDPTIKPCCPEFLFTRFATTSCGVADTERDGDSEDNHAIGVFRGISNAGVRSGHAPFPPRASHSRAEIRSEMGALCRKMRVIVDRVPTSYLTPVSRNAYFLRTSSVSSTPSPDAGRDSRRCREAPRIAHPAADSLGGVDSKLSFSVLKSKVIVPGDLSTARNRRLPTRSAPAWRSCGTPGYRRNARCPAGRYRGSG